MNPEVGCRYFLPGPQLLSQLQVIAATLCCLVTETHVNKGRLMEKERPGVELATALLHIIFC